MMPEVRVTAERPNRDLVIYRRRVESWEAAKHELEFFGPGWLFRGLPNASFDLECTLKRIAGGSDLLAAESEAVEHFRSRAHLFVATAHEPADLVEWLALIQHHGGPTRLLDFTRSPFVAAYFALETSEHAADCCVWALEEFPLRRRAAKRLGELEPDHHWLQSHHNFNEAVDSRIRSRPAKRFLAPVEPFRLNARMALQQGVFVCLGEPGEDVFTNADVPIEGEEPLRFVQLTFPRSDRPKALADLRTMNVSRETLFPGLDGLAQGLNHVILPRSLSVEALFRVLGRPANWPGPSSTGGEP